MPGLDFNDVETRVHPLFCSVAKGQNDIPDLFRAQGLGGLLSGGAQYRRWSLGYRARGLGIGGRTSVIQVETGKRAFIMDHLSQLSEFCRALGEIDAGLFRVLSSFRGNGNRFNNDNPRAIFRYLSVETQLTVRHNALRASVT